MKKQKFDFSLLKRILTYLTPFKSKLAAILFCLGVTTVLGFLQPLIIRTITDDGLVGGNLRTVVTAVLILLVVVLINQLIEIWQTSVFADIHNASTFTLFNQAFHKLLHLKKSFYDDKNNAEILNSVSMDVEYVSIITDRYMAMIIGQVFRVVSGIAGLLLISWKLTLVVLAVVPIKYFTVKILAKRNEKKIEELIESSRDFSAWFGDTVGGVTEVKLWNLIAPKSAVFTKKQKALLQTKKESTMISAWNSFVEILLEWGVTGLLYIIGAVLIINGELTIGGIFAFISYSSYVTGPISSILNMRFFFSQIFPSAKRLFKLLDTEEEHSGSEKTGSMGKLDLQDVCFTYENTERTVINGVSLSVRPGEKIAIIGQNGSGKSTLIDILLRFIEPDSGKVTLDGKDIGLLDLEKYRSLFAVVSQNPYLFYDTVENNINLKQDASQERLCDAMRQSGAQEFIEKLPQKEKSMIGQNGARLSGGEKQKLAVARAIIKDAPVIILDEATSGFDVQSDKYLHQILKNELKDKTVIAITHRYDNLDGMDRVYRLHNGKLVVHATI